MKDTFFRSCDSQQRGPVTLEGEGSFMSQPNSIILRTNFLPRHGTVRLFGAWPAYGPSTKEPNSPTLFWHSCSK
ncbi:hypothetical protein A6R68_08365 [Neotoma lepida]|uniref:Uncharacterized protein n=1 Tax=Neotoma lepida TaxID=56216 RepID=A0A1A6G3U8_NEOLE|nr:hypothetical protein A6R68_08365 [Neotoma lepida]